MMKKLVGLVLAALLLLGMLAGCSKEKSALDSKNPITVTMWHYYGGDLKIALENQIQEFNRTVGIEKGVVVEALHLGTMTELEDALTDSAKGVINSEEMPDIFFSYADKAIELMEYVELVDLSTYFTEDELNAYVKAFLEDGVLDGRQVILPVAKSTELLYLNLTDFEAFSTATGHSTEGLSTWEGLYETAAAYYEWSGGAALFGFDNLANYFVIANRQLGVEVFKGDGTGAGNVQLDKNVLQQVFSNYVTPHAMGYYSADGAFRSDDVKVGALISYVGSSSGASYFPTVATLPDNTQYDIDFMALEYPHFSAGQAYTVQQGAGICVTASDEAHQEGSALFLKWFTSPEVNVAFSLETGYLPVRTDAYDSDELAIGLAALRGGSEADNVTAEVYEVASSGVLQGGAYAATPFDGSYSARYLIIDTLGDASADAIADVAEMRAGGMEDDAIIEALGMDARFDAWYTALLAGLEDRNIPYIEL